MAPAQVPDIENGFLVLGASSPNSWSTEVLSAVRVDASDGSHVHYLSKECRSEDIAFQGGSAAGRIFQSERSWEFLMAILDGRPKQMTNSDITIIPIEGNDDRHVSDCVIKPMTMAEDFTAEIHCPLREVTPLPLPDVLGGLRARALPIRNLFMKITVSSGGAPFEIFCPCRYVNFGNGDANDYVQPISGYVMAPPVDGDAQIGYVACTLAVDGTSVIEFCGKRYRNIFEWVARSLAAENGNPEMALNLSASLPIFATVFDRIEKWEGTCEFFTYRKTD